MSECVRGVDAYSALVTVVIQVIIRKQAQGVRTAAVTHITGTTRGEVENTRFIKVTFR